ncbi:protein STRUBBELIG-RECEPTOR FAMILY 6 isoform X1 [Cinnamomum micranthum f. kanehirae]|uniref:Protein STRUBBELIG-RECEPTOR FAMILY 6 isoform X1 n=1 Tax=Cinnamomum micranthum f. kanehirae TaxID=337451 RepID=A0A3S3MX78_9MAGN|nr:protein STRUBBELIG-RECEPTOR FAMILY 6 isoform X1 [Cinnamomum micranthum f. kanehirae]
MDLKSPPSNRHKSFNNNNELVKRFNSKSSEDPINCKIYSVPDLQAVTGRFDKKNLIGCAYKAMFSDGEILAVKRLDHATESSSSEDFMDAVAGISRMSHPNFIELVGYCSEPGHLLLVYEFLKNGSLYDCLHLSDDYSKPLTWNIRIKIALGTARAKEYVQIISTTIVYHTTIVCHLLCYLLSPGIMFVSGYLHEICSPSTIHKNTKSANILLDTDPNPHLTDCGLATFYCILTNTNQSCNLKFNSSIFE